MDLFAYRQSLKKEGVPLPERMRPESFAEVVGQEKVVGERSPLRVLIAAGKIPSMMLWGPPGTGKTTLARIIAKESQCRFVALSATTASVADLRVIVDEAKEMLSMHSRRTIVFVDEIHRWNKAQQDAFLPIVEDGTVILIGATTENPSFAVNGALLSRCRVFILERLETEDVEKMLERAVSDAKRGFGELSLEIDEGVLHAIAESADGDGRRALLMLEMIVQSVLAATASGKTPRITKEKTADFLTRTHLLYDKKGEEHYNIISALHKSMRGSDADAALYWLGRMLVSGEDPRYVTRRLIRFASEDIGLADPNALVQALAAHEAVEKIGMPECDVVIAQVVVYLARAPKSIEVYAGLGAVKDDIAKLPNEPVPLHIRNAPTKLMKEVGYGKGYVYPPSAKGNIKQSYLPEKLSKRKYLSDAP